MKIPGVNANYVNVVNALFSTFRVYQTSFINSTSDEKRSSTEQTNFERIQNEVDQIKKSGLLQIQDDNLIQVVLQMMSGSLNC